MMLLLLTSLACNPFSYADAQGADGMPLPFSYETPAALVEPIQRISDSSGACIDVSWEIDSDRHTKGTDRKGRGTLWYAAAGEFAYESEDGETRISWDGEHFWRKNPDMRQPRTIKSDAFKAIPFAFAYVYAGLPGARWAEQTPPIYSSSHPWALLSIPELPELVYLMNWEGDLKNLIAVDGDWMGILSLEYQDWDYPEADEQLGSWPSGDQHEHCRIGPDPLDIFRRAEADPVQAWGHLGTGGLH
jgi:hypothetical protein